MTTYIYENNEVKKTGRTAARKSRSGKEDTLYEITPTDLSVGTWKKWVVDAQLYTVTDTPKEE